MNATHHQLLVLITAAVLLGTSHIAYAGQVSDAAYPLLLSRTSENRQNFFVYSSTGSGLNRGAPSGFFGEFDKIQLDMAALNVVNPGPNTLDTVRGNIIKVTFAPITTFAGINWEEPLNWGLYQTGRGYDLTGATKLVLDACSPTGITLAFGTGGSISPAIILPPSTTFQTYSINFSAMVDGATGDPLPPNIISTHVLFTVVISSNVAPNGGTVLIDNIHFEPLPVVQQTALGLPISFQTFGVVQLQGADPGRAPYPPDQTLCNLAASYDSSLTMLALLKRGTPDALMGAATIANTFSYSLGHENLDAPLPATAGGPYGLHGGYSNGDIALFNDVMVPYLARAGNVRLANFESSQFNLVLDGASSGTNAYAVLAMSTAGARLSDNQYTEDARSIANWIASNLRDNSGSGYGGYFSGFTDGGAQKQLIQVKTVENNAAIYAAISSLASYERDNGNLLAAADWTTKANVAGDFCMQMYDPAAKRFYTGTVPVGTAAAIDILPDPNKTKGGDVTNVFDSLPSNTLPVLALSSDPRYKTQADWRGPVQFVLNNFAQSVTAGGQTFTGFNMVKLPSAGPNGISCEATGQTVAAMRAADALYNETNFQTQAATYMTAIQLAQTAAPFKDGKGLVAAVVQGGDTLPPLGHWLTNTPAQLFPTRVGLAPTCWAIFAESNINPLVPRTKPAITWAAPANIGYGTPLSTTQLNATTGILGTFVYEPAAGTVLPIGMQTLNVTFYPLDAGNYASVTTFVTINVVKGDQNITFAKPGDVSFDASPVTLTAMASSTLAVTYLVVSGPATVAGNVLTLTGVGSVTIKASQAGDTNYNPAPDVTQSFDVSKGNQSITFPDPGNKPSTSEPFAINATASSGLTVTFVVVSGPATINGNTVTLAGAGMVVITASQSGDTNWNAATDVTKSFNSAAPFTLSKFSGAFSFKAPNKDSCQLGGSFTLPAAPVFDTKHFDVSAGGAQGSFVLTSKGKGAAGVKPVISTATLKSKLIKNTTNYLVSFSVKLKGAFSDDWNISRTMDVNTHIPMILDVTYDGNIFTLPANPLVKSKRGKGGTLKN